MFRAMLYGSFPDVSLLAPDYIANVSPVGEAEISAWLREQVLSKKSYDNVKKASARAEF